MRIIFTPVFVLFLLLSSGSAYSQSKAEITNVVLAKTMATENPDVKKTQTEILRSYPNPADDQLNILFNLERASKVELTVYNSLGQRQDLHKEENLPMGENRFNLQVSSLPKGIYIYILKTDNKKLTSRFVINR